MRKNLDLDNRTIAVAKATKVHGQYTKHRLEQMLDDAAKAFYQECADLEGVSLDEWLKSADKGEF